MQNNTVEVQSVNRVLELLSELNGMLKMSVEKAIEVGGLLCSIKDALGHGQFTAWVGNNLPISERTARNYMKLYRYSDKTANVADLQEAYEQIEHIEQTEKDEQRKNDVALVQERIRTGQKPEGWERRHDYMFSHHQKACDDDGFQERKRIAVEEKRREQEAKDARARLYREAMDKTIADQERRAEISLDSRDANQRQEIILSYIDKYIDTGDTVSRRIELGQNLIKHIRGLIVELQQQTVA